MTPHTPLCAVSAGSHAPPVLSARQRAWAVEVIITIGIFGTVDVQLMLPPAAERSSGILPLERKEGITITPGRAYALWGKSRWKMKHNAIVGVNETAISGLRGEIARVGLTLRFARISFARIFAAMHAEHPEPLLRATDLTCGHSIVDAFYYNMRGERVNEHAYPHTYPALVLEVCADHLVVFYISDGLIPDDDEEAWSVGVVPIEHAVLASVNVAGRCVTSSDGNGTRSARLTRRLTESILTGAWSEAAVDRGTAAFVCAIRERGEEAVFALLKANVLG